MSEDRQLALGKAKIGLMTKPNSTFITTVLFSLRHIWDDKCPSAGVDGINLYLNPTWFMSLSHEQRQGLLAHEAWHVCFQHMLRVGDRDFELWNKAGDHVINLMLKKAQLELPPNGLWDRRFEGMATDEVYEILKAEHNPNSNGDGFCPDLIAPKDDTPGDSQNGDGSGQNPQQQMTREQIENEVMNTLLKAATQSRISGDAAGTVPGDIQAAMEKLLNPKLPWNVLLSNYLHSMDKEDYSFRKPNRRFLPDFIMPSLYSESLDKIACAMDISCSVSDNEFTAYRTELNHIKQSMNPKRMDVLAFDTRIHETYELGQDEDVSKVVFHGRGGTNLKPVFDYYEKKPPTVLIVFSDLECAPITQDPGYPVIWVAVNNPKAVVHFGKLIMYETPR